MDFKKRKIKFKAWDEENRLLMRLNAIDCQKGELIKKNHILLQFTGLYDKEDIEIYEMDVVMFSLEKFVVCWNDAKNGWYYYPIENGQKQLPFLKLDAERCKRFCNFFELQQS
jgi:hypothetical protein